MSSPFYAGFGSASITPELGTPMAGYAARTQGAQGIHDNLYAHVAVFEQDAQRAVIVNLDLVEVTEDICGSICKKVLELAGVPEDQVFVCATHTHSGPVVSERFGCTANDETVKRIVSGVGQALGEALENRRDVLVKRNVALLRGVAKNRRTLQETPDPALAVLGFYTGENLVGCIVNYALHATVLGAENLEFSADYPGYVREFIRQQHPGCHTLFLNGAAGNVNIGYSADASALGERIDFRTFEKAEEVGRVIAHAALSVLSEGALVEPLALEVASTKVLLPLKDLPTVQALESQIADLREAQKRLAPEGSQARNLKIQEVYLECIHSAVKRYGIEGRSELAAAMKGLAIGDAFLVGIPGEPFSELGLEIKQGWDPERVVMVVGYANGSFGYFPTEEAFLDGGYEAETSVFQPVVGSVLVDQARRLIERLISN